MSGFLFFLFFAFVFYFLLKNVQKIQNSNNKRFLNFEEAKYIISLTAKVVKSDGKVNQTEAELVSVILDDLVLSLNDFSKRQILKEIYNREKNDMQNIFDLAFEYNKKFNLSYSAKIDRISFFLNIAYIDGDFSNFEKRVLEQICDGFEINDFVKEALFIKFKNIYSKRYFYNRNNHSDGYNNIKDPYEILGVSKNASFNEIKIEYRKLVKKYHPDILMGKGANDDIIQESTKKLQEINEAYEIIKERLEK